MKKILPFLLLLLSETSFGQQTNPTLTLTSQDYLKKSNHQKTAAWILLGTGVLSSSLGSIRIKPNDTWGGIENNPSTVSNIFLVAGLAAIGSSIPLFIASSKNKKKAASISFKNERIKTLLNGSFTNKMVPSFSLTVRL